MLRNSFVTRSVKLALILWLAAVLTPAVLAQSGTSLTVRKTAGDANPTLALASVTAPAAIRELLLETLRRCDWFTVVPDAGRAAYLLSASYDAAGPAISVRVTRDARTVAAFRMANATGEDQNWLIYRAVDTIIESIFGNPGPCASRIAFTVGNRSQREIFTCNFDGSNPRQLTRNRSISTEPSWGPRANSLVYTLYSGSQTNIVMIDLAQNRQRRLTAFPGLNSGAALSPNGTRMALCLSRDHQVELYLMELPGKSLQRLTRNSAVESSPCWSPDGRSICFVSDHQGRPRLYIMSATGGAALPLLQSGAETVSPDWSAVSNQICFSTREHGQYVIGVVDMNKAGRERRLISAGPGDWEAPSWAPDGRHLVCSRTTGGQTALYMLDTWHGTALPITKPAKVSLPSWSPGM